MPAASAILRSRVFDGLTDEERAAWGEQSRARELPRGKVVARQGEPAREFTLVASGFLKLLQLTPQGQELIVRFVGPAEPFGGIVALEGAAYPVTAVAVEPTSTFVWPVEAMRPLLLRTPQVRTNLMREMALHMTDALTRVRELATGRVGQRLASALLRLMKQIGQPAPGGGLLLAHTLTRQELAELTGTTLYTVSRTLSQWVGEGILRPDGRRLVVVLPGRLKALAEDDSDA